MYYPYLRAKQYELKALREFSEEYVGNSCVIPILEPVKQQLNGLTLAMADMEKNNLQFALILNPMAGDFKHQTIRFDMLTKENRLDIPKGNWIPAFLYTKREFSHIKAIMDVNEINNAMIIFRTCMELDDNEAWSLIKEGNVSYVVNNFGTTISRRLRRELKDTGCNLIRLDDCFNSKNRNADYAQETDELFTEEPFFYRTEENLDGFSDYTTLPAEYIEGGMMPYALAIHLTYQKNDEQLYVHHFVSDSNNSPTDIRGKFMEAAAKILPFYDSNDLPRTDSVEEIIQKCKEQDGYPGLGYLKKLSVKNHLELIQKILGTELC